LGCTITYEVHVVAEIEKDKSLFIDTKSFHSIPIVNLIFYILLNSHRPTPDGAVHRPDGTTHITSLHRTLKKKKHQLVWNLWVSYIAKVFVKSHSSLQFLRKCTINSILKAIKIN